MIADNPYVGIGLYSLPEAAHLLKVPGATLKRWASGYIFDRGLAEGYSAPLFEREHDELVERDILTFTDLIELMLIRLFREHGVSMPTIRAASVAASKEFRIRHPFAARVFHTDGKRIFLETRLGDVAGVSRAQLVRELPSAQLVLEDIARPFFLNLDYDENEASRFWPLGREEGVVLDPRRSFGKPIIHRHSVPTWPLFAMYQAGEKTARIAHWYGVGPEDVEAAIRYEQSLLA